MNMRKHIPVIILALILTGCYYDKEDQLYPAPTTTTPGAGCDTMNVTYTNTIKPIMDASCAMAGCLDAATKSNGWDVSTYSAAKTTATSGRLMGSLRHETKFYPMPKDLPKLDDCTISKIQAWINAGTPQ